MPTSNAPQASLKQKFFVGTAWMTAVRWGLKVLGIINTLIIARLLVPHDFGLVAMAIMVSGFVEAWLDLGVRQALIRNQQADREDYDTAWSLRIIQGLVIATPIVVFSPLIAEFFKEPRLTELLWMVSAGIVVSSLGNIGIVNFQKELDFRREFILEIVSKVASTVVTIALAYWLRSYWALALGIFTRQITHASLSYVLHEYRPRWSLTRIKSLWGFSQWMLVTNMGTQFATRADQFVVGKLGAASGLGIYTVALELAQMSTNELAHPIAKTMLPLMSKVKESTNDLLYLFLRIIGGVNTLTIPAGIGLALVAEPFILVMLGEKWLPAVPYLQIFSVYGLMNLILVGSDTIFVATDRVRQLSALLWLEGAALLGFSLLGFFWLGMLGIAFARIGSSAISLVIRFLYLKGHIHLSLTPILVQLWRPVVATSAMASALWLIPFESVGPVTLVLAVSIATGAAVYGATLYALWRLAGRPEGLESTVVSALEYLGRRALRAKNA